MILSFFFRPEIAKAEEREQYISKVKYFVIGKFATSLSLWIKRFNIYFQYRELAALRSFFPFWLCSWSCLNFETTIIDYVFTICFIIKLVANTYFFVLFFSIAWTNGKETNWRGWKSKKPTCVSCFLIWSFKCVWF